MPNELSKQPKREEESARIIPNLRWGKCWDAKRQKRGHVGMTRGDETKNPGNAPHDTVLCYRETLDGEKENVGRKPKPST